MTQPTQSTFFQQKPSTLGGAIPPVPGFEDLTPETFQINIRDTKGAYLLEVYSDRCSSCHMYSVTLTEVAELLQGRMRMGRINRTAHPAFVESLRVPGDPTLIFIHDGDIMGRVEGAMPINYLRDQMPRITKAFAERGIDISF